MGKGQKRTREQETARVAMRNTTGFYFFFFLFVFKLHVHYHKEKELSNQWGSRNVDLDSFKKPLVFTKGSLQKELEDFGLISAVAPTHLTLTGPERDPSQCLTCSTAWQHPTPWKDLDRGFRVSTHHHHPPQQELDGHGHVSRATHQAGACRIVLPWQKFPLNSIKRSPGLWTAGCVFSCRSRASQDQENKGRGSLNPTAPGWGRRQRAPSSCFSHRAE